MCVHSTTSKITPKHARRMHSQCHIFYSKFKTHTKLSSPMISNVKSTLLNRSLAMELLQMPQINIRPRIEDRHDSESNINIDGKYLSNQATEAPMLKQDNVFADNFS